jgi:hypothetical protein
MCETILYYIFTVYIHIKLFIMSKCRRKNLNFDICNITAYDNKNLFKIINKKQIYSIISNKWYSVKQYNPNTIMIDVQYFYNDETYNIIYKYPNNINFPIDIKQSAIKLLYTNDEINEIVMKYAGPMKDFYDNNEQKITMNDIFIFNNINNDNINNDNINNDNINNVLIVNSNLSERTIGINNIIDLKI